MEKNVVLWLTYRSYSCRYICILWLAAGHCLRMHIFQNCITWICRVVFVCRAMLWSCWLAFAQLCSQVLSITVIISSMDRFRMMPVAVAIWNVHCVSVVELVTNTCSKLLTDTPNNSVNDVAAVTLLLFYLKFCSDLLFLMG